MSAKPANGMTVSKTSFGFLPDGREVTQYLLSNSRGMEVSLLDFGALVHKIKAPDRDGEFSDLVLGWDDVDGYRVNKPYFGATVGRYANRIAGGQFAIDERHFSLNLNAPPNHLHGGFSGFDKKLWQVSEVSSSDGSALRFTYMSEDGEEGYPGNLLVEQVVCLTDNDALRIEFRATTDKPTLCNLTNHSYFNLNGAGSGSIANHQLWIDSDRISLLDQNQVHTKNTLMVDNTVFDFRSAKAIGDGIDDAHEQIRIAQGYDHNWIFSRQDFEEPVLVASVYSPSSGRQLAVHTTQPGVQFYTANFLDDVVGKNEQHYTRRSAFCLETQHFPNMWDAKNYPYRILRPGQKYHETTVFKFSVKY